MGEAELLGEQQERDFEALLDYVKQSRGFDFSAYKRSTLVRRIQKRIAMVGAAGYCEYADYLEVHPDEFPQLFNTILINVTAFFRDTETWQKLENDVIPTILESKGKDDGIRIWVAGCASGEEAYSIAMLLAKALGPDGFRDRVKIYATDLDDEALEQSRQAIYSSKAVQGVPADMLETFFERTGDRYTFDRNLRRTIIFGKHDLIQDAPISRVDLLLCRNTLMYFNAEAQNRILARFHFALNEGAYLCLGKAETLLSHGSTFAAADLSRRVFTKVSKGRTRERLFLPVSTHGEGHGGDITVRLQEAALEQVSVAQVVLDLGGRMCIANEQARKMFGLTHRDIARPFQDLELSYRPAELRSGVEQVMNARRQVVHKAMAWQAPGNEILMLDITLSPLSLDGKLIGVSITFENVSELKKLEEELMSFNQELETAYEEVQSTNEELQTTNEELQSTVEELETTNEELHSTNEELETMNEELQSTNEELETINSEVEQRGELLSQLNILLESVLSSLQEAVIVLDRDMQVVAWNHRAEDHWGLRSEEVVGTHFMNLDIGLPVDKLRQAIKDCLAGQDREERVVVEAINRRGRAFQCEVRLTPLLAADQGRRGVILLIGEA